MHHELDKNGPAPTEDGQISKKTKALIDTLRTELNAVHEDLSAKVMPGNGKIYVQLTNENSGSSFGIWVWGDCVPHAALRTIMGALSGAWPRLVEVRK